MRPVIVRPTGRFNQGLAAPTSGIFGRCGHPTGRGLSSGWVGMDRRYAPDAPLSLEDAR